MGLLNFFQLVGVTTTLPDEVPTVIPVYDASDQEWYYWGNCLYHDRSYTNYSHLPTLHEMKVSNKVGILITTNGELHLFLNEKEVANLATGLPVHKSLFGAVHVYEKCSKIKSEILSGKYYSVCSCGCTYLCGWV